MGSRVLRKKTFKQVAYENHQMNKRSKRRRTASESHTLALEKAKQIQTNLSAEHPSFIKQIRPSHITRFYKLGIPLEFYRLHLPKHHDDVTLEDEAGESYEVRFLAKTDGSFLGGWRKFAVEHNLVEGDAVVFHMLSPCHFKVHIVKANDPTADETANCSSLDLRTNGGKRKRKRKPVTTKKGSRPIPLETVQEISGGRRTDSGLGSGSPQGGGNLHSSGIEFSPLSWSNSETLKIIVNGETIDPQLSGETKLKYYNLCCSRKAYLHQHLLKTVDSKLAVGIITSTVKVADAIRDCDIGTSEEDLAMWDDTLEGFKNLGMDVQFLRDRLKRLARIGSELGGKEEMKRYEEAKSKREGMWEEMRSVEVKLLELKEAKQKVEDKRKAMKVSIMKQKDAFQQEASAPW